MTDTGSGDDTSRSYETDSYAYRLVGNSAFLGYTLIQDYSHDRRIREDRSSKLTKLH